MTSIFLSYARSDDEPFVRQLYADLTAAGFSVWFDRVSMPSRNLTFHQEIRDAVSACDRLVLVVGPGAIKSDYVRQEWQFAYFEADKVVTPILRLGGFPLAIDELKLLHCEDFRNDSEYPVHLKELLRILSDPPPRLGKLIAVPSLPVHFLSRADRLVPLRDALRADLDRPVVISGAAAKVGMHGMGGIGKSVLANLLARDRKIREAFPDGIVWVGLGSLPDLRARIAEVHLNLGGDGAIANEHEGKAKLKELLKDQNKAVLLLLDDVWRRSDVEAFDVLGPRCRQLITTRDEGLLQSLAGTHHVVELLSDAEALRLLATAASCEIETLPAEAGEVLKQCGRLPLAVQLAGSMVGAGTPWRDVRDALREHELEFLENPHAESEQHINLWRTIEVSVHALADTVQERLAELAVFPEDSPVPDAAVIALWQHTGRLSPRQIRKLLIELKQRSLVQLVRDPDAPVDGVGQVSLHDVIHDYCVRVAEQRFGSKAGLHQRLLDAYQAVCTDGWWTGPNDGYFFTQLREHLVAAGRGDELCDLLHELKWFEAKNAAGLVFDLGDDFRAGINALPVDDRRSKRLQLLDEAIRRDIYFIHRHREDYPQGLFQCLWNHGWWYDCDEAAKHYVADRAPGAAANLGLHHMLERWREERERSAAGFYWLRALRPPPTHLGSAQKSILHGHESDVYGVVFSPDGMRIASGSWDATVRVWDARTGVELQVLRGHDGVPSVAFSPDGTRIASGSMGKAVRVWDALSGVELQILRGHENRVPSVAFSPDGTRVVSGSEDKTVRIWDASTGAELRVLRGHEGSVISVAFSPDGTRIASGSWDATVRVWDALSGAELKVLSGHEHFVNSVAFSPDGTRIASGSDDQTVRVWDALSGVELQVLRGHERQVNCVAFSPDSTRIASGSRDKTIRLWDALLGAELQILRGHEHIVCGVAFSPDGTRIASGSWDQTVRVWDALAEAKLQMLRGHEKWVNGVDFSPDGTRIASGSDDQTVRIWDALSGAELQVLRGHEDSVQGVDFSPDGTRIASGSDDQTVRIWDALSGAELQVLHGHERGVRGVAFSPNGTRIASGSWDMTVRIWDALSGTELKILRGHNMVVNVVDFSPDGTQIASSSDDQTVRIWDALSGTELHVLRGHEDEVNSVASWIASGASEFPWHALDRGWEIVIERAADGTTLAWFPEPLMSSDTHSSGRWAVTKANHLYLLRLEGVERQSGT